MSNLEQKLGIKPDTNSYVLHPLSGDLADIPVSDIAEDINDLPPGIDWLLVFYFDKTVLQNEIAVLTTKLKASGQLWVSWPKKTSSISSDLSDSVVRNLVLQAGLVDTKVVAINSDWSALKFVFRLKDR